MKNIFLTFAAIMVSAIAVSNATAQFALNDPDGYYIEPRTEAIFIARNTIGADHNNDHSKEIEDRAVQHFHKEFPKVNNEHWFKAADGGYIATFNDHSGETKAAYDKKGRLHHTISYYKENNLPGDIRESIRSSYYDYDILIVAEVHFDGETIYMISMQDETHFKILGVKNGNMEVVQSFNRGK